MRILVIDDHPIFIAGVKTFITQLDDSVEVIDVSQLEAALQITARSTFNLVLLDLGLPGTSGFDALLKIKQSVAAPVVIVSGNDSDSDVRRAIDLGAAGYIPKTHNQEEMILALKEVVTRGIYIPPNVRLHESDDPSIDLTDRQIEVLQCLLQGKSNKVIANVLSMAEGTVKAHLDAIYHKLHVNSRLQAMARAYALGLVNKFKRI